MKIEHIGIAVKDLEQSLSLWTRMLNMKSRGIEEITERGVKLAHLEFEEGPSVELVTPCGEDSPLVKFLDEKGEGIHHFSLEVEDLKSDMERLKAKGIQFVHDKPQKGAEGSLIAFLHPRNFNGVLIELKQKESKA